MSTPSGAITLYGAAYGLSASADADGFANGPDGNIWFTDSNTPAIGMLNISTKQITEYANGLSASDAPDSFTPGNYLSSSLDKAIIEPR